MHTHSNPQVALFVTCLVDAIRPSVGFATVKLLEQAGCEIIAPTAQTCCGQPAFNSGDWVSARPLAQQLIETFEHYDYIVTPSGSCAGMLKKHYLTLFQNNTEWLPRAERIAERCYELVDFLTRVMQFNCTAYYPHCVTYHDSCSSLREIGIKQQARDLLQQVEGLKLKELQDSDVCCGFGGTFCVKYSDISTRIVSDKVADIAATGADTVLSADLGCLLNIAGRMQRLGITVKAYHIAEVLADQARETPALGEAKKK